VQSVYPGQPFESRSQWFLWNISFTLHALYNSDRTAVTTQHTVRFMATDIILVSFRLIHLSMVYLITFELIQTIVSGIE